MTPRSKRAASASTCERPAITLVIATRDALFRISFSEESPREPSTPSLAVLDTAVRRRHAKKTRISHVHRAHRRALVCIADVQGVSEVRQQSPNGTWHLSLAQLSHENIYYRIINIKPMDLRFIHKGSVVDKLVTLLITVK